jgi:hypothetical protein
MTSKGSSMRRRLSGPQAIASFGGAQDALGRRLETLDGRRPHRLLRRRRPPTRSRSRRAHSTSSAQSAAGETQYELVGVAAMRFGRGSRESATSGGGRFRARRRSERWAAQAAVASARGVLGGRLGRRGLPMSGSLFFWASTVFSSVNSVIPKNRKKCQAYF